MHTITNVFTEIRYHSSRGEDSQLCGMSPKTACRTLLWTRQLLQELLARIEQSRQTENYYGYRSTDQRTFTGKTVFNLFGISRISCPV